MHWRSAGMGLLASVALMVAPGAASAAAPCGTGGVLGGSGAPGTTMTCTYATVGEDTFTVPTGIPSFDVVAIGASGADGTASGSGGLGGVGGLGALVSATLAATPGQVLYAEVGTDGSPSSAACAGSARLGGSGGANGAGSGGEGRCPLYGGGGGGGASDLRTTPAVAGGLTAAPGDPRLLVAAGGGGAGSASPTLDGGDGGAAGGEASAGAGSGGDAGGCVGFEPGLTGGEGTVGAAGGAGGGPLCSPPSTSFGVSGLPGVGGAGGNGNSAESAGGGGGGGGYNGGGGGGALVSNGGGGGGGGSSFGPAGSGFATASPAAAASIVISWTTPKVTPGLTTKASPAITLGGAVHDTATLSGASAPTGSISFVAYGPDDTKCSRTPAFAATIAVAGNGSYDSPAFVPAKTGTYRWIAAYSGDTGNKAAAGSCGEAGESVLVSPVPTKEDPQPTPPAAPPTLTVSYRSIRPHGPKPVAPRRYRFSFSSSSAASFYCRLDKAAFKLCSSPKVYRHLKPGRHVFRVKAVDASGQESAVRVVKFTVGRRAGA